MKRAQNIATVISAFRFRQVRSGGALGLLLASPLQNSFFQVKLLCKQQPNQRWLTSGRTAEHNSFDQTPAGVNRQMWTDICSKQLWVLPEELFYYSLLLHLLYQCLYS